MSVHLGPEEYSHTFVVAVEQIECLDHARCTKELTLIEQPVSLAAIVAAVNHSVDDDDDDIAIVDPHISIDLIDPFTAQIWKIPVRGKTCTHRECFDLQAFLESRPNKVKGVPLSSADEWKCPICNKDARPQCLVLDGFMSEVSRQLLLRGEGEDVRSIRVTGDGVWAPKVVEKTQNKNQRKKESSSRDEVAGRANASQEVVLRELRMENQNGNQHAPPVVIELGDD